MPRAIPNYQNDPSKGWTYSLILAVGYLFAFSSMTMAPALSMQIGCTFGVILSALMLQAWIKDYFQNSWDALWHGAVVIDVFLEAIFIPDHDHWGFLLCWLAFGGVVGAYRYHQQKWNPNIKRTADSLGNPPC